LRDDVWLEGAATIDPTVQFDGPVLLGAGVTLEAGVRIVGPSVIGAGCHIGAGSTIVHSVLWARNLLGTDCVVSESVVGAGNTIGSRVVIGAGALIGDDCRIGAGNQLMHGVRLWPSAHISDDAITF
jgi:NDP-sugar pyrophosphorylase family protein